MKFKRKRLFYLLTLVCGTAILSCSNGEKPAETITVAPKKPGIMPPFRFHKLIEVSPGQDYDVVSWGRGSTQTGAFAILHSDSAAAKYTTTTGDLDGAIVDVFNTDMDLDGNPEIIIQAKTPDTNSYTKVYAYEFTNSRAQQLNFPRLTKTQRQGYRGEDNFYVQDGKLVREFPVFDAGGKPTGQKKQFEYGLRDNSFTIKQLGKDSTSVKTPVTPVVSPPASNKKPKKHTVEKRHKKKKHRRRHSEE